MAEKVKVILADDHPIFRDGLRGMLQTDATLALVHETGDGRDALDQARLLKADVLLLDVDMPGMSGVDVARERQRSRKGNVRRTVNRTHNSARQAADEVLEQIRRKTGRRPPHNCI